MIVLAGAALLLPGLAWWAWFARRDEDPLVSLGNILGVSLAAAALLAEIVFFADSRFSAGGLILLLAAFVTLIVLGILKNGAALPQRLWPGLAAGLILMVLAGAWRLYQARDLLLPNWVDSQHHYLIIRVILEKGGLPGSLSPYLDVPFYYHYGYHIVTALFTALGDLEIGRAMLILGQLLNAAIGLSVYTLGRKLWKDWRPAGLAALLVSFLTQMPAYYLTWGRYTLTTGLVLLPLAMAAGLEIFDDDRHKKPILLMALLTAMTLLSHYFAAVLLALFLIFLGARHLIRHRRQLRAGLQTLGWALAGALGGLALAAPWLARVLRFSSLNLSVTSNLPGSLAELTQNANGAYILYLLGPGINYVLMGLAAVGLVWAVFQRKEPAFAAWTVLIALLTLPWSLSIKPFRPDHYAILLFLPIALWVGWLFSKSADWLSAKAGRPWLAHVLLAVLAIAIVAAGVTHTADIINPTTVLVTRDDMAALNWIRDHTPDDARFFINTTYWLSGIYRGVDGGGWILPYTGRWALVPTVLFSSASNTNFIQFYTHLGKDAHNINACDDLLWSLVNQYHLSHLYIRIDAPNLQPEDLINCDQVDLVYQNKSVFIFEVIMD
jgi:hypothetical protein